MNSESTRFERPYETNGSVSPVVGSRPIDDADVQERREHRRERQPDGDELQKRRARLARDAEAEPARTRRTRA